MSKFTVDWQIAGSTIITAESREEAQAMFEQMTIRDLADEGELEVICGPETDEERRQAMDEYRATLAKLPGMAS